MKKFSVLFVCTGNICRSPTADGVMRALVAAAGLQADIEVDSAGTQGYHVGEAPDHRSQQHAARRGYDLSDLIARAIAPDDFQHFDLILAMDRSHLALLERQCPPEHKHKVHLLLEYASRARTMEVSDPYYGGDAGFELVLDQVEDGCAGLLEHIQAQLADA